MIDFLTELLAQKSVEVKEANEAVLLCERYLYDNDIKTKIIDNDGYLMLISDTGPSNGKKKIILNGHVDVVPAHDYQFKPRLQGDKIFARGAADMKGGMVGLIEAFIMLNKRSDLTNAVQLQIVSDEEAGGEKCSKYLVEQGHTGDFVICGECTNLNVGLAAKGLMLLKATIKGKPAHGSRPYLGENAILKGIDYYNSLQDLAFMDYSDDYYRGATVNLSIIKGGVNYNSVPGTCEMNIDLRYLPGQDKQEIFTQLESALPKHSSIEVILEGPPVINSSDDPGILLIQKLAKDHGHDQEIRLFGQNGAADSRFFSKKGVSAIEFGPSGGNWHSVDEWISISSIKTYSKIVADFCLKF